MCSQEISDESNYDQFVMDGHFQNLKSWKACKK